ncbi:PRC-barrel domain-containing protein [Billgrantia sp. LNSP4103-1]|uniref:PRC-barrel domain-containing protein n=1 Tax=Billgrantia sp. LNSP4103-1 TaxID=3410266 RepID=UPI00403F483F
MKRTLLAIAIGAISAGLAGGTLAQDSNTELNDDAAVGEEQAAERQSAEENANTEEQQVAAAGDDGEQADDEGEVDASVSEEELPDEGDDAEDYQEMTDDEDSNGDPSSDEQASDEQAGGEEERVAGDDESDAGEEMQTDPGEQATSAEPAAAEAEQAPQGEHTPQAGQAAEQDTDSAFEESEPTGAALDPSIASLQVSEVVGMTIVNREGETLGEVDKVLRHDDAGDLHAVVPVGGFWIFGGSEVALPLVDMELENERLVLQDIIGEDELDEMATDYDEDRYSEVDGDMTLSDAMGR